MIGSMIGAYRVVRLLGEGGMGAVYEAINDSIERRVAIKVLHPDCAHRPEIVTRFFNEARAVNRIDHSSTVQIHEHGRLPDGTSYIVMEFIKGETLRQRLDRSGGRLSLPSALQIAWQLAEGVSKAHSVNIAHRDLKPENLMLVSDPLVPGGERVKVLDFGIAKLAADTHHSKTASNVIMGTPTYMSPEQCRGAGGVDEKTDVYSLGVILYQLLAGRAPFEAEGGGDIMAMHLLEPPPRLAAVAPFVPPQLAEFVHLLLTKDKNQRPPMHDAAERLRELATSDASRGLNKQMTLVMHQPSSPATGPTPRRTEELSKQETPKGEQHSPPYSRRRRFVAFLLLGGVVVLGGAVLGAMPIT